MTLTERAAYLKGLADGLALDEAKVTLKDISAIAVTYGAGLVGALLVGVSFAKGKSNK